MSIRKEFRGRAEALSAYMLWGLFPFFWKLFSDTDSLHVLVYRIFFSFITLIPLVVIFERKNLIKIISDRKTLLKSSLCGILIGINWFIYIYAVNNNMLIQASLGYYINPLIYVLLGYLILKEKLTKSSKISVFLAGAAVFYLITISGVIPWISLILAVSFGFYGLIKKRLRTTVCTSLFIETLVLFSVILILITAELLIKGKSGLIPDTHLNPAIILSGIVTIIPLAVFASAAKKISLTEIGIFQYINPSMQLILGLFIYNETYTAGYIGAFILIWAALGIFTAGLVKESRKKV